MSAAMDFSQEMKPALAFDCVYASSTEDPHQYHDCHILVGLPLV